jgi:lipopolysaccharide export system protein LptC
MTAAKPPPDDRVWQPRSTATVADVASYSKFVARMRIGLPVLAALLILLVLILSQLSGDDDRFSIATAPLQEAAVDALSMANARYFGTDQDGQPFSITAKSVRERPDNEKLIDLVGPQADITLNGGPWLSIAAQGGTYDRDAKVLDLNGEVSFFQDQGYEMHTEHVRVRMNDGSAVSRAQVQGQGPFGQLTAQGFDLFDKGRRVVFIGPAKVILNNTIKADQAGPQPQ